MIESALDFWVNDAISQASCAGAYQVLDVV